MEKFGIYIHWPYCLSKCPYCDFSSYVSNAIDEDLLWQGYLRDLAQLKKRPVSSIFFGGGTPSLMSLSLTQKILSFIEKHFSILPHAEITMEANPDAIDKNKMQALKGLGINRLSLGVQALNEKDLLFLGRRHSLKTALLRIEEMKAVFDNASFDLIYARPHQTLKTWQQELSFALSFDLPHLSLYELTIEQGTVFYKKNISPCNDEIARELYLQTWEECEKHHLFLYEVSNFAKKGYESQHNLLYWQSQDYAGIGPSAHGRLGLIATENPKSVKQWLEKGALLTTLTKQERLEEKIMMGLRLRQGISTQGIQSAQIKQAQQQGWLEWNEEQNTIRATKEGFLMLNQLILLLLPV